MAARETEEQGSGKLLSGLGERMRNQRETVGMSVQGLAQQIGVSRNTITNYEAGRTEPSASDLLKLAHVLGCGLAELLALPTAAPRVRFAYRAHKHLHQTPQVVTMAQRYLRAYDEIEQIVEARLPVTLRRTPFNPDPDHRQAAVEAVAQRVREDSGLSELGPAQVVLALENLGVRCIFFKHEADGLDGLSAERGDLSLILLHDRTQAIERIIFSAAHELGHLVLHPELFTEQPQAADGDRDYEKEASLFAGSFLVPEGDLLQTWQEERLHRLPLERALLVLKQRFQVSFWCLYERTKGLGLTSVTHPALISSVKRLLGIQGQAKRAALEPDPLPSDVLYRSTRFKRLVYAAFIQGDIGVAKVAEMLQVTIDEAREITGEWIRPSHDQVVA